MAGFVDCWEKHGGALSAADKNSILDRTNTYKSEEGLSHDDALRKSLQWHHDQADAQLKSIYNQTVPKPAPQPSTVPKTEPPTETGISSKQFSEAYGDSAPVANTGKGPAAWSEEGMSRLDNFQKTGDVRDDPYSVLTNLREGRTPARQIASDTALLGAEHQRLLEAARQAEGTPEWGNKSQAAVDMANAIKEVSHGTFADVGMALQDHNAPRYDNVTDFDQALREREKRESTPEEKTAFKKMADDVDSTKKVATDEISKAQRQINKYPKMSFEDAAKSIRDQFTELTKDCVL